MATFQCSRENCTVAATGKCLESFLTPIECPNYHELTSPDQTINQSQAKTSSGGQIARRFHSGIELGTEDAAEIMRQQYTHVIGIVGSTNAGKTCFLSSLYLMLSHGMLRPEYLFAGSLTLQGFEERARNLRSWAAGTLPSRLTEHTHLHDPRSPAFMHLALFEPKGKSQRFELLLTDLPGEWFNDLIDRVETVSRFGFLRRTDGIIFVIEGPLLESSSNRHVEVHRAQLLFSRLAYGVGINPKLPLVLLISKCDRIVQWPPPGVESIVNFAVGLGFHPEVVRASAFSSNSVIIKSGTGILETIRFLLQTANAPSEEMRDSNSKVGLQRSFGRFRLP